MYSRIRLFIFAFITLGLNSCFEDSYRPLAYEDYNVIVNDSVLVEINLIRAIERSDNAISKSINDTINNAVIKLLQTGSIKPLASTIEQGIDQFKRQYATFKNTYGESDLRFEATFDSEVLYESQEIVTIALTSYFNLGGAHGNSYIALYNFDKATAKQLEFQDIIAQNAKFSEVFLDYYNTNLSQLSGITTASNSSEVKYPKEVGFNEAGILFIYNAYELDFLGQELFEFVIPYTAIEPYLNHQ